MLLFKKKFLDKIRSGEKTQTIRLWKHRQMRDGQRSFIPGIGYVLIRSVSRVEIEELTDGDALPDGFATAVLLKRELRLLYAEKIEDGFSAYRICFSVFPDEMQEQIRAEKKQQKAVETSDYIGKIKSREIEHSATLTKLQHLASEETKGFGNNSKRKCAVAA